MVEFVEKMREGMVVVVYLIIVHQLVIYSFFLVEFVGQDLKIVNLTTVIQQVI